ncbi:hypothetical protein RND81_06G095100 [Saponaria officinalis]|uniref:Gag-polypeptide of LTR copia-type n=1 Tax=Saponaria officinalis TaxID=3572 RepID=A0AAW1K4Y3_SAPOF
MTGSQSSLVTDVVPVMSKITDHKLNGSNYLDWSKSVRLYLRSIAKDDHLKDDPPTVNHCEFVKELMDYLEFLYSGREDNLYRTYEVCQAFYHVEKQDQPLINNFMEFKKTYEKLNMLLPFKKMVVMSFLAGLSSDFDSAKAQILSGSDVPSLQDVFSRILRTESPPASINPVTNSVLISRNTNYNTNYTPPRYNGQNDYKGGASQKFETPNTRSVVECNYCHKSGHMKFECRKLKFRNQQENQRNQQQYRNQSNDYDKFSQYQESLKSASPSITAIVDSRSYDEDHW